MVKRIYVGSLRLWMLLASVALFIGACAPATTGTGAAGAGGPEASKPARVVIANYIEQTSFSRVGGGAGATDIVNSPLAILDAKGIVEPRLGTELPSQERGTWVVNPDGTMV